MQPFQWSISKKQHTTEPCDSTTPLPCTDPSALYCKYKSDWLTNVFIYLLVRKKEYPAKKKEMEY